MNTFKNEDYNYLINNNELIQTCREALLENEKSINLSNTDDFNLLSAISPGSSTSENSLGDGAVASSKVSMDNMSIKEFSNWINHTEEHLESVCYCSFRQGNVNFNSNTLSASNSNLSASQREWIDAIAEHKVIQAEIQTVGRSFINSLKSNASKINKSLLTAEETRWHNLWLKSFECLMIVEEHHTCPNHTTWNRERSSTPYSNSKRFKLGPFSEGKENIRGMMRNRRIQTNMIGIGGGPGLNETFNVPNGKYEIIHKDIGYSSDADMSDACEPSSCPNYISSTAKSPRKRHRRRRPRIGERPWSFHSEWTQWDYYQPPFSGLSGEFRSSEDLNSFEDENLVRSLTEFGENYEKWFKTDDGLLKGAEDLNSHEEESSIRSTTESNENSERWLQPDEDNLSSIGKPSQFLTSSPNVTLSSNADSADTLDMTDILPTGLPAKAAAATFIVKEAASTLNTTSSAAIDAATFNLSPGKTLPDSDSYAMKTAPKNLSTLSSSTQTSFPSTKQQPTTRTTNIFSSI
ncbi:uncharacterized protein LOC107366033 isoform X1 [Tetranychus urticae]|uniref:uncharacterized protein LOC107366033 isoform X1 n=2 Tax=Tetranychus urticae TaxID=32264 RepID=UPI00077BA7A0|nr:uncharacterized protein LOC107366033 isoform X1 [Tetranychus urticae]